MKDQMKTKPCCEAMEIAIHSIDALARLADMHGLIFDIPEFEKCPWCSKPLTPQPDEVKE